MSEQNKPREWNIQLLHGKPTCSSVFMNAENVHVIEYSAYKAEREKVSKLVDAITRYTEYNYSAILDDVLKEIEEE